MTRTVSTEILPGFKRPTHPVLTGDVKENILGQKFKEHLKDCLKCQGMVGILGRFRDAVEDTSVEADLHSLKINE